jgi:glycosyltransferase involved in cell wall biosynthesis
VADTFPIIVGVGRSGTTLLRAMLDSHPLMSIPEESEFLGSRVDVADLLALCDVLVSSSRTKVMPAVVIEAEMAGRPVAGYAVGGIGEVVVSGTTGILVKPSDQGALANAVIRLFRDDEARAAMGAAAQARCASDFDIRTVAPRYRDLYESLCRSTKTDRSYKP